MRINYIFRFLFYKIVGFIGLLLEYCFERFKKKKDYHAIPIIINNRNRLTYLLKLINSLEVRGYRNLIIIDNDSTFPPLLDYYKNYCKYKVCYLNKNLGHLALWKSKHFLKYITSYYVYTDSDIEIINECPENFLQEFRNEMILSKNIQKIGFSLKINDLPIEYKNKDYVEQWESQFYIKHYSSDYFVAKVDTTFALYRPFSFGGSSDFHLTLRSAYPLMARHLPWYENSAQMTAENIYYLENARTSTFWSIIN